MPWIDQDSQDLLPDLMLISGLSGLESLQFDRSFTYLDIFHATIDYRCDFYVG